MQTTKFISFKFSFSKLKTWWNVR